MNIENILSTFPQEVRESDSMRCLVALIQTLSEQLVKSQEEIRTLKDELARFRKTPKRPKFRPNNMEPRNRNKNPKDSSGPTPPPMDISLAKKAKSEITAKEITYKLEVWQASSGEIIRGKLPKELQGQHFGPVLRAFTTNLYAQGVTQPAVYEFLIGLGIDISTGQVNNLLLNEGDGYAAVSEKILEAGLQMAPYTRVDDTGEKHRHQSSYCTHIGGQYFAYYTTSSSKSRENFLKILLQGKEGYQINDAMIWHLFQSKVKDDVLNLFEEYKEKIYRSKKGLNRLLNELGIEAKKLRQQCVEAALVGFISATILKPEQVLLSDRAGQFALFNHAGCWVHMERPLRKIICTSEQAEQELKQVREAIWTLYKTLKEAALTQAGKKTVHKLYDDLVKMSSISPEINLVINNFATYRDEMLKALDHPGLPLHNNDSERDIRPVAKRRNISGSTKSNLGRKFRDGLMTIKQTCFRVGYNFWDYLQQWHRGDPPDLAELVRQRYQAITN